MSGGSSSLLAVKNKPAKMSHAVKTFGILGFLPNYVWCETEYNRIRGKKTRQVMQPVCFAGLAGLAGCC